jgi:alkaline phosphatase
MKTVADSNAGSVQVGVWSLSVKDDNNNPTSVSAQNVHSPLDGRYGRNSLLFLSAPGAYGKQVALKRDRVAVLSLRETSRRGIASPVM